MELVTIIKKIWTEYPIMGLDQRNAGLPSKFQIQRYALWIHTLGILY